MINIAAVALLVSALAAAGVWSPPPSQPAPANPNLVREGHRVIVVEYERYFPASDNPAPSPPTSDHPSVLQQAKDKFQEVSPLLPNVGQGISAPQSAAEVDTLVPPAAHSAKDLLCDAYGSCKEKISSVFHRGKDKLSRTVSDIEESAGDAAERMKDKASDMKESAEAAIENARDKAKETVKDAAERAKEKAADVKGSTKSAVERAKGKASDVQEGAKAAVERAKDRAEDAVKRGLSGAADVEQTIKGKMEGTKDAVKSTVKSTKDVAKMATDVAREAEGDVAGNISSATDWAVQKAEEAADVARHNLSDIVKRAKEVAFDAAKYVAAPEMARATASIAHLLSAAVAYGTCIWVTFVSSHVLATSLPRQQFGMVQSKLYPVYFRAVAYSVGIALLGNFFAKKKMVGAERVQGYNLLAAMGLVLVNMLYLEPKATKVMFEGMKMEKEEGRGLDMDDVVEEPVMTTASTATRRTTTVTTPSTASVGVARTAATATATVDQGAEKMRAAELSKKLKKLNGYSSFLNILTLMSLTWHLVHLAGRLHITC